MTRSAAEWEEIERIEHDRVYAETFNRPFHFKDYKIDPEEVIRSQDYGFKKGARSDLAGHRTKRLMEMMDYRNLSGKRILDVGCGNGQYAVFFAMLGAEVWAFDLSPVGVEIGKKIAAVNGVSDRCHLSVQNASAMTYESEFFDIVLFHSVLHHAIKYPKVREETLRVLKPGGIVLCGETLRGNVLLGLGRKITMRGEQDKGDVILDLPHLEEFSQGFSKCEIEPMSVFFMLKRIWLYRKKTPLVRGILFGLKKLDDALLTLWPGAIKYSGEVVMKLTK